MPRGKLGAKSPKGTRQGKPLCDLDREIILQTQMICQNKNETARRCGVTRKTVETVLKRSAEEDTAVQEARRQSSVAIAGKVHGKVDMLLNSITPDDLDSGFFEQKDKDGKVIKRTYYGPSLMQKVTASAILVDKLPVLASYQQAISQDHNSGALMLPGDVAGLMSGIRQKLKSLTVLNVQFEGDNPDLSTRIQATMAEAEVLASTQPEVIDFDNPGAQDEAPGDSIDTQSGGQPAGTPSDAGLIDSTG